MNGDAEQRVRLPSNRELLRMLAVIGLFVLGCYVLVAIRSALFDVFIAVFFAIVLEPLVRFMERRLRLRRNSRCCSRCSWCWRRRSAPS